MEGKPAAPGRVDRPRPDPTSLRLGFVAAGLAGLSAVMAAVIAPVLATAAPQGATFSPGAPATPATVEQRVRYVQLLPGESAPPGATVIDPAAPTPTTIVTIVPAPSQRPIIVRTTQSGKHRP